MKRCLTFFCGAVTGVFAIMLYLHCGLIAAAIKGEELPESPKSCPAYKREFLRNHPTVYCGTHTPQGYENLEAKRVMDLDNPVPTVFPELDFTKAEATGKYVCSICGYVYDPAEGDLHAVKATGKFKIALPLMLE